MEKDYKNIFEKMKAKSIGTNKRVKNKKIKIKARLKKPLAGLMAVIALASVIGCGALKQHDPGKRNQTSYSWKSDDTWSGYTYNQINAFEEERLDKVLNSYNMTDYTKDGYKRSYNYTAKDYMKVTELDETYIHGFYHMTDSYTVEQFCISQGYQNLNDYLVKSGYTDSEGKEDINKWIADDLEQMGKMMASREVGKSK